MTGSIQDLTDRTASRKTPTRVSSLQDLAKLGRSPTGPLAKDQDRALDGFGRSVRMPIGSPGAVFDGLQTLRLDPVDPLVAVGREI